MNMLPLSATIWILLCWNTAANAVCDITLADCVDSETTILLNARDLENANLTQLTRFTQLHTLELRGNLLTEFPTLVMPSLTAVFLSSNHLATFPDFSHTSMIVLGLENNHIREVPTEKLSPLYSIEYMDLSFNELTTFPDVTVVASTLLTLSLKHNNIAVVRPKVLYNLDKLEQLFLSGNPLVSFPLSPWSFTKLNNLDIRDITSLDHLLPFDVKVPSNLMIDVTSWQNNLCEPHAAWLASVRPNILMNPTCTAGGVSMPWSTMTNDAFVTGFTAKRRHARKTTALAEAIHEGVAIKDFLLHSYLSPASRMECFRCCLSTPGCVSFYWRQHGTHSFAGSCVTMAPGGNVLDALGVSSATETVWSYFVVPTAGHHD